MCSDGPVHLTYFSAFAVDDHESQVLADWYGIVMGTSHEEPMMRSTPIEWNLFGVGAWNFTTNRQNIYDFWLNGTERAKSFENVFTLGMRGVWIKYSCQNGI